MTLGDKANVKADDVRKELTQLEEDFRTRRRALRAFLRVLEDEEKGGDDDTQSG